MFARLYWNRDMIRKEWIEDTQIVIIYELVKPIGDNSSLDTVHGIWRTSNGCHLNILTGNLLNQLAAGSRILELAAITKAR
jgi:hypothetical protein